MVKLSIPPSQMGRVLNCPLSHKFDAPKYYDEDIDYDDQPIRFDNQKTRGQTVHRLAKAKWEKDEKKIAEIRGYPSYSPAIEQSTNKYLDFISYLIDDKPLIVKLEVPLQIDFLYPGCYGKADCIIEDPDELTIIDLKYSRNTIESKDNLQLLAYAIGAENESEYHHKFINTVIYNALTEEKSEFSRLTAEEARDKVNWMKNQVEKILANSDETNSGPWCQYCNHRKECKEFYRRFIPLSDGPDILSEDWNKIAYFYKSFSASADDIRTGVQEAVRNNDLDYVEDVREYKKWKKGGEEKALNWLLSQGFKKDEVTKTQLLTPSQLRQKYGNQVNFEELEKFVTTHETRNIVKK